ncbi:hypothetical protein GpartN1_g4332.t1 [Galdieria partita]|uniref:Proteasome inhibitor PI31 subunit n=1 Tax=Galdieria partita TaxID=83374 RepID=A0A9C7PZ42_9RHOD|nr:hypothetical protein GpartN1_g4211.t1 [Galdieria partita]GJQ12541.1 hypothetical protein GpartN1_g4332.t1 [Galdieria partita]
MTITTEEVLITVFEFLEKATEYSINDPHKTLALVVHGILLTHGFRPSEEEPPENIDSWSFSVEKAKIPKCFEENKYGGSYRHYKSCMTFEVRMVPLDKYVVVNAVASDMDKVFYCELKLEKYFKDSVLEGTKLVVGTSNLKWSQILKNVTDMIGALRTQIIYQLVPDSAKEGYEAKRSGTSNGQSSNRHSEDSNRQSSPSSSRGDPLRVVPPLGSRYYPNSYLDEDRGSIPVLGQGDLYPGALPRLDRTFPSGPLDGSFAAPDNGSLMGPRHSMFQRRDQRPGPGNILPRGAVPPGARFDEFGPRFPPDETYSTLSGWTTRREGMPDNDVDEPPPPEMYM